MQSYLGVSLTPSCLPVGRTVWCCGKWPHLLSSRTQVWAMRRWFDFFFEAAVLTFLFLRLISQTQCKLKKDFLYWIHVLGTGRSFLSLIFKRMVGSWCGTWAFRPESPGSTGHTSGEHIVARYFEFDVWQHSSGMQGSARKHNCLKRI